MEEDDYDDDACYGTIVSEEEENNSCWKRLLLSFPIVRVDTAKLATKRSTEEYDATPLTRNTVLADLMHTDEFGKAEEEEEEEDEDERYENPYKSIDEDRIVTINNDNAYENEQFQEGREKNAQSRVNRAQLTPQDVNVLLGFMQNPDTGRLQMYCEAQFSTAAVMRALNVIQVTSTLVQYDTPLDEQPAWVKEALLHGKTHVQVGSITYHEKNVNKIFRAYWNNFPLEWTKTGHVFNVAFGQASPIQVKTYKRATSSSSFDQQYEAKFILVVKDSLSCDLGDDDDNDDNNNNNSDTHNIQ
jgi:hypothetical protein